MIILKRIVDAIDLDSGVHEVCLELTDGEHVVSIPVSDAAMQKLVTAFRDMFGVLENPEGALPEGSRVDVASEGGHEEDGNDLPDLGDVGPVQDRVADDPDDWSLVETPESADREG